MPLLTFSPMCCCVYDVSDIMQYSAPCRKSSVSLASEHSVIEDTLTAGH